MAAYPGGFDLVWVNASPTGPTKDDRTDPQQYQIIRIPATISKTVSRSSSADAAALVNDFSDKILFPLAKVVSREHARIEWLNGEPVIKNLGSTHGTYVGRRHAAFGSSGKVVEGVHVAPLKPVEGIIPLHGGDLIEFGKTCHRSDAQHYPVRCYVRYAPRRSCQASTMAVPSKPSCRYSLVDDSLDSESDIVSIDEATFRPSPSRPTPQLIRSSPPQTTTVTASPTQATIVDLSGDDDDGDDDVVVSAKRSTSSFESEDDGDLTKEYSDSESEDPVYPLESQYVVWRKRKQETAIEQPAHDPAVASAPQLARIDDAGAAPSKDGSSTDRLETPDSAAEETTSDIGPIVPTIDNEQKIGATLVLEPSSMLPPEDLVQAVALPNEGETAFNSKRKLVTSEDDEDEVPATDSSSSSNSYTSSAPSTPYTSDNGSPSPSASPSPSKKRRMSPRREKGDLRPVPAASRGRSIKSLIANAMYTTSLLSIGFMGGSFFTFKSMLNAAAAANAPGSGN